MHSITQIRFPDTGHTYQVPTEVITRHAAAAGSDLPPDAYIVLGGMPWADIEPYASLVDFELPSRDMTKSLVKLVPMATQCPAPQSVDQILEAPVRQMLQAAADAGQPFSIYVLGNPAGQPVCAITVTSGDPAIVAATISGYGQFSSLMAKSSVPANTPIN